MPDPEYRIASAEAAEVAEIVTLVNSAYRGETSRRGWTTEADFLDGQRTNAEEVAELIGTPDSLILTAFIDGQLSGCMHLQKQGTTALLGMFVIAPALQGRDLGKQFLAHAELMVQRDWKCRQMSMAVISLREELIAYYERRGYRRSGRFMPFPVDIRFGIPKVENLRFEVLEKFLEIGDENLG